MTLKTIAEDITTLSGTAVRVIGLFVLILGAAWLGYIQPRTDAMLSEQKVELNGRIDRKTQQVIDKMDTFAKTEEVIFDLKYASKEAVIRLQEQMKQIQEKHK